MSDIGPDLLSAMYVLIGVLLALVLGFVVTYLARRGRVRAQEAAAPTAVPMTRARSNQPMFCMA